MTENKTTRRNVLYGVAAAGVAVPVLAACGSDSSDDPGTTTGEPQAPSTSSGSDGSEAPAAEGIPTADIPVGGGKIFASDKYVVTQPTEGEFKAFTAVCTHTGCVVSKISDGKIDCPCHGSQFSIEDGSVQGGPAPSPLAEKKVTVTGTSLTVG
ncbi:Rieske Fe-S protein [Marmoricola sp. OAE513]|uniref:Rieske (2Fe-2S) protein n=1 Tax=Marmoricola sp. OAE513 TaxID=2817894 RepID=UPI001AE22784